MSLLSLKIRNPNRDKDSDQSRLKILAGTIANLITQIDKEKSGLQARCSRVAADAAFSLQAMENDFKQTVGPKVDELTHSLAQSRLRLKELEVQLTFFRELQRQVDDYVAKGQRDRTP